MKTNSSLHIGRSISRVRTLRGIKQEALAIDLNTSQAEISRIEQSETIDDMLLDKIAAALNVNPEVIRNFDDNSAFYTINNHVANNTFHETSVAIKQDFNPIDKIIDLYERLLASEKEKLILLQKSHSDQ